MMRPNQLPDREQVEDAVAAMLVTPWIYSRTQQELAEYLCDKLVVNPDLLLSLALSSGALVDWRIDDPLDTEAKD